MLEQTEHIDCRLTYKIRQTTLSKLDEIAGRLGLDRSEIARRALEEGLRKFEHTRLPGSPLPKAINQN
jgi:metal-responsive CopG/Arc/MetJ family transcriptional regulator